MYIIYIFERDIPTYLYFFCSTYTNAIHLSYFKLTLLAEFSISDSDEQ